MAGFSYTALVVTPSGPQQVTEDDFDAVSEKDAKERMVAGLAERQGANPADYTIAVFVAFPHAA